ncbi:hypothetical protein AGMMS49525_02000 [Bacteroidia bacterium]|nr:hypothetical protein AGMMS49525_02000 [Bacteroidia bacterium]
MNEDIIKAQEEFVIYQANDYNLDMIISLGYRVNSRVATNNGVKQLKINGNTQLTSQ